MFFCADGGGAAISCDISCSSGVRVKLLILWGESSEVFFVIRPVRLVCSIQFAFGWELFSSWSSSSVEMAVDWGRCSAFFEFDDSGAGSPFPLPLPERQRLWSFIVLNTSSRWFVVVCPCSRFQGLELCFGCGMWIFIRTVCLSSCCPHLAMRRAAEGAGDKEERRPLVCASCIYF